VIVSFSIGNSDDKLSQAEWSQFFLDVLSVAEAAENEGAQVHFAGGSHSAEPWQNATWVLELGDNADVIRSTLRADLAELCGKYRQDSIAWWEARETEFIPPAQVAG
jgi:hypothetical protein